MGVLNSNCSKLSHWFAGGPDKEAFRCSIDSLIWAASPPKMTLIIARPVNIARHQKLWYHWVEHSPIVGGDLGVVVNPKFHTGRIFASHFPKIHLLKILFLTTAVQRGKLEGVRSQQAGHFYGAKQRLDPSNSSARGSHFHLIVIRHDALCDSQISRGTSVSRPVG